jgi:hypothetical protein
MELGYLRLQRACHQALFIGIGKHDKNIYLPMRGLDRTRQRCDCRRCHLRMTVIYKRNRPQGLAEPLAAHGTCDYSVADYVLS